MTRRVVLAIAGVTALALIGFGIPLGAVIQRLYIKEELVKLEREATAATIEVPKSFGGEPVELPRVRNGSLLALYLPSGRRIAGRGPVRADAVVRTAAHGQVADARHHGAFVVAVPVTSSERVIAVMRASRAESTIATRAWKAWAAMAALGAGVVALAALGAFLLARRLTRPVTAFAGAVTRLGDGDFTVRAGRSGIGELDAAAAALDHTASRLGGLLERERAFSADASHQLRTPVTALRVHLEAANQVADHAARSAVDDALADTERLERTIDDLLRVGRDIPASRARLDLGVLFHEIEEAWGGQLADEHRSLSISLPAMLDPVWASTGAVRQMLDVLVSNAARHGAGTLTVAAHNIPGGVAIEVADEGPGVTGDPDRIFVRRDSAERSHGIGLALARSLAEAEGGRLLLRPGGPGATFALLFSTSDGRRTA
ncbi:MAG: HAMP domain-containing histidine kinase [Actinomycetota bacterium]|nr:HAMP domain-containing histidine kinase [Actinomycetota bacterium]